MMSATEYHQSPSHPASVSISVPSQDLKGMPGPSFGPHQTSCPRWVLVQKEISVQFCLAPFAKQALQLAFDASGACSSGHGIPPQAVDVSEDSSVQ